MGSWRSTDDSRRARILSRIALAMLFSNEPMTASATAQPYGRLVIEECSVQLSVPIGQLNAKGLLHRCIRENGIGGPVGWRGIFGGGYWSDASAQKRTAIRRGLEPRKIR